jgi:hypothetical protein
MAPETEAFQKAEFCPIEQACQQPSGFLHLSQRKAYLFPSQHHRKSFGSLRAAEKLKCPKIAFRRIFIVSFRLGYC